MKTTVYLKSTEGCCISYNHYQLDVKENRRHVFNELFNTKTLSS